MASSRSGAPMLYHESQVAALCGVHCINTLLQGPVFSEIDLAQIAQDLDELERKAFMQEGGGLSDDYHAFAAGGSGNVSADGMFSIQVLQKALEVWNLTVTPLEHPEMRPVKAEPQAEAAFICNLQEHWFTVRNVEGDWWNFNSLYPAPQPLGTFYLSAFLGSLAEQGYQILVVRGQLPRPAAPSSSAGGAAAASGGGGRWFTPDEARVANEQAEHARQRGKVANALETALSRAAAGGGTIQLRPKRQRQGGLEGPSAEDYEDADLAAAIAASLADASSSGKAPAAPAISSAGPSGSAHAAAGAGATGAHGSGSGSDRHHAFGGDSSSRGGGADGGQGPSDMDFGMGDDGDADLAAAIAASLRGETAATGSDAGAGPSGLGLGLSTVAAGLAGLPGRRGGAAHGSASTLAPAAATVGGGDGAQTSDGVESTAATAGTTTSSGATPPRHHHQQPIDQPWRGGNGGGGAEVGGSYDEDADLAAAIAASLADQSKGGSAGGAGGGAGESSSAAAVLMSDLVPEPEAGEGVIELAFRLPNSQRVSRRFAPASTPTKELYLFVSAAAGQGGLPAGGFSICTAFPRKVLLNSTDLLCDVGLTSTQLLSVTPGAPPGS